MKKDILLKENITLNCETTDVESAIRFVGKQLVDSDYVNPKYIEGMIKRDAALSVYVGNHLAIPHGEYEYKKEIKTSGIVIAIYPNGIDWHGENVKVVLGLAGINNEHMEILASVATLFSDIDSVEKFISLPNEDAVYDFIMQGLLL